MPILSKALPVLALAGGLLGAADPPGPSQAPLPWYWSLQTTPLTLDGGTMGARGGAPRLRLGGGAIVEVWGDPGKQEALRLFTSHLRPSLAAAYQAGVSSDVGAQILAEIMAMGAGYHPPTVATVFYNCFRPPVEDPAFVHLELSPAARVKAGATAKFTIRR